MKNFNGVEPMRMFFSIFSLALSPKSGHFLLCPGPMLYSQTFLATFQDIDLIALFQDTDL